MVREDGSIQCECGSDQFHKSKDDNWLKCGSCGRVLSIHDGQVYIDIVDDEEVQREIKALIREQKKNAKPKKPPKSKAKKVNVPK